MSFRDRERENVASRREGGVRRVRPNEEQGRLEDYTDKGRWKMTEEAVEERRKEAERFLE